MTQVVQMVEATGVGVLVGLYCSLVGFGLALGLAMLLSRRKTRRRVRRVPRHG